MGWWSSVSPFLPRRKVLRSQKKGYTEAGIDNGMMSRLHREDREFDSLPAHFILMQIEKTIEYAGKILDFWIPIKTKYEKIPSLSIGLAHKGKTLYSNMEQIFLKWNNISRYCCFLFLEEAIN